MCVVPSIVTAHFMADPLLLKGSVYCDTCRCGYETSASKPLADAVVRVECSKRSDPTKLTYAKEVVTNSKGHYEMLVHGDRGDDLCDAVLVKSVDPECMAPNAGRDRARVILTRNNGMASNTRFANALGFLKNTPLASCSQILQKFQEAED
ncbi:protein downstream of flc [Phtheirospermum japonicum]|uniref:Protein downstream of flc n=1 Tax=Phtheirospermum japonicum TaxID=374723 RepID=A0A830CVZ4_9LAMI|nr:protein downstream of flc [Phtheirospermum japonicum]